MSLTTHAATALLMGLVGGPHCIAMCSAACGAVTLRAPVAARASAREGTDAQPRKAARTTVPITLESPPLPKNHEKAHAMGRTAALHIGRSLGYALLGLLAASSVQTVGWMSIQTQALRPLWTMLHVAATVLGLMLLLTAKQPIWLETGARQLWRRAQGLHPAAPLGIGLVWALMPCGLLYSALLIAGLSANALHGACVMLAFALGTSLPLVLAPGLWLWLKARGERSHTSPASAQRSRHLMEQWGMRLAGLLLAASSAWGLWLGLVHQQAPWCIS